MKKRVKAEPHAWFYLNADGHLKKPNPLAPTWSKLISAKIILPCSFLERNLLTEQHCKSFIFMDRSCRAGTADRSTTARTHNTLNYYWLDGTHSPISFRFSLMENNLQLQGTMKKRPETIRPSIVIVISFGPVVGSFMGAWTSSSDSDKRCVDGESTVGNGHGMQCCDLWEHPLSSCGNNRARFLSGHRSNCLQLCFFSSGDLPMTAE